MFCFGYVFGFVRLLVCFEFCSIVWSVARRVPVRGGLVGCLVELRKRFQTQGSSLCEHQKKAKPCMHTILTEEAEDSSIKILKENKAKTDWSIEAKIDKFAFVMFCSGGFLIEQLSLYSAERH